MVLSKQRVMALLIRLCGCIGCIAPLMPLVSSDITERNKLSVQSNHVKSNSSGLDFFYFYSYMSRGQILDFLS